MALERLSQITESGIKNGITISNASVTGVLTAVNELKVGTGLTITSTSGGATLTSSSVTVTGNSFVDGSLGIGNDNPERTLSVAANNPMIQIWGTGGNGKQWSIISSDDTTGAAAASRGGNFVIYDDTSGGLGDVLTLTGVGGSMGLGIQNPGAKLHVSGGNIKVDDGYGIDFSATSDASGKTSELLDDYEEGTWTPQVTQGVTGTPTYANQLGWYTKIGRIVTLYFYLRFGSSGNTGSNSIFQIGNLPFPVASANNTVLMRGMGVSNYHSIPGFTSANVAFYGGGNSNTFASVYLGSTAVATTSSLNSQYIIGGFEYISE